MIAPVRRSSVGLVLGLALGFSLGLAVACVSNPKSLSVVRLPVGAPSAASSSPLLFPYGHYRHHVTLHISAGPNRGDGEDSSFDSVVETSAERIRISILSPLGTTLMKINENRISGEVEMQSYDERIRRYQERFSDVYSSFRQIFALRSGNQKSVILPDSGIEVVFTRWEHEIPRHMDVKGAHFTLAVDVEVL